MIGPIQPTLLIADDDDGNAALLAKSLVRVGLTNPIERVRDGEAVLEFVRGRLNESHGPDGFKIVVILEVGLPGKNGFEVLRELKNDPRTASIPVIILTSTDTPRDVDKGYALGCNLYLTKPVGYDSYVEATRRMGMFLQIVRVPLASKGSIDAGERSNSSLELS